MQLSGRISAAIEILTDFETRKIPLKTGIAEWGRQNRYAGAKDRAWISGLCLDVLRRRRSLAASAGLDHPRGVVLAALAWLWKMPLTQIEDLCAEEPHGPGAISEQERAALEAGVEAGGFAALDLSLDTPDWLRPMVVRAFGEASWKEEVAALGQRADVDLRCNSLKATPEKAINALKTVKGKVHPWVSNAARIVAPDPSERAPSVTIIPAFNKGWVEVQDLGSQMATLAAGAIKGKQVLDFCAGGGGKTLALAALMENTGQLYAYDIEARRLKPLYARAKRAGLRNVQIMSPNTRDDKVEETLGVLTGQMDVVFVDAPCSGSGTWRRHPDTKWRLSERQLAKRMEEQDEVLESAHQFVKPGGVLVYVTCSVFREENEDRLAGFCKTHTQYKQVPTLERMMETGLLTQTGKDGLDPWQTDQGALRLSPLRSVSDGFFISVLERRAISV